MLLVTPDAGRSGEIFFRGKIHENRIQSLPILNDFESKVNINRRECTNDTRLLISNYFLGFYQKKGNIHELECSLRYIKGKEIKYVDLIKLRSFRKDKVEIDLSEICFSEGTVLFSLPEGLGVKYPSVDIKKNESLGVDIHIYPSIYNSKITKLDYKIKDDNIYVDMPIGLYTSGWINSRKKEKKHSKKVFSKIDSIEDIDSWALFLIEYLFDY